MLSLRLIVIVLLVSASCCSKGTSGNTPGGTQPPVTVVDTSFTNPLLSSGPDPWVIQKDTNYFYTNTFGNRIAIYSTNKMSDLNKATLTTVWTPPSTGPYSKNIWAPEIHYLQGKWYTYFAADDGNNVNHRMYVLENASSNPLTGTWEFKGKISDPTDKWAIDGTVCEFNGILYFLWSGWEGDVDGRQDIYIAKMSNPWTIEGDRVRISTPTYSWEKIGSPSVNEGPEAIKNVNGNLFVTFSASGCWTDDYSIGILALRNGGSPLVAGDWTKTSMPVFTKTPENGTYAPGHNAFFKSRDGKEDWIIYHANSTASQGCGNARNPRMQKFTWNTDGSPNFGQPVGINVKIRRPGGE